MVPPKWCTPEDSNNYSPEGDKIHLLKDEDDIKSLSCLTMYIGTWGIIAFHDTGSSIILHTKKFRQTFLEECKKWVSKVAAQYTRLEGIKGGETTVLTDVFKWDLGWNKAQQGVIIYSVEIPEELLNIRGMLLGRDTIFRKCWELAYEHLPENRIRPYVPTPHGP